MTKINVFIILVLVMCCRLLIYRYFAMVAVLSNNINRNNKNGLYNNLSATATLSLSSELIALNTAIFFVIFFAFYFQVNSFHRLQLFGLYVLKSLLGRVWRYYRRFWPLVYFLSFRLHWYFQLPDELITLLKQ